MENFKADKGKAFTLPEAGSTHLFASEVFPRPQKPIIGSVRVSMPVHETYPAEKPAGPEASPQSRVRNRNGLPLRGNSGIVP